MVKRAQAVAVGLALAALMLAFSPPLAAQPLFQGPAQGTSVPGVLQSTTAFPTSPPGPRPPQIRAPEHAVTLHPDPLGLRPPLAPLGFNEQDDLAAFLPRNAQALAPTLLSDFQGITMTSFIPPDPIIAAGPDHLMPLVNTDFAIYTKAGVNQQQIDARSWFSNVLPGNNAFDPKVIYDHFDDRWVMVWLATDFATNSHILVSVSDDGDPTGNWCNWAFRGDVNGSTVVANWSDYQGLGFDADAIYIVPNQFSFAPTFDYVKLRILPKSELYDPSCPGVTYTDFWDLREPDFPTFPVFTVRPATTFGTPGVEYLINDSPFVTGTTMTLWSLMNPLDPSPTLTALNVPVTQRALPPNADQLGDSTLIDVGGPRVRNLVYRDGSVWTAHSVASASGLYARARYVRIDVAGPTVLEDASFGLDQCWLFYPAVTADAANNLTMVFSRSCTNEFASVRYTGKMPSDAALQASAELKAGEARYVIEDGNDVNRWGDYSGIAVDPANPTHVWMYGEYAASPQHTWGTWIGASKFRALGDINDDGVVDVGDVVLLVDFILERAIPTPDEETFADCTVDMRLDIGDVVCLVNLILGPSGPALAAAPVPTPAGSRLPEAHLSEDVGRPSPPYDRTLLLEAELGTGVAGLQARIAYDAGRFKAGKPALASRAEGFELATHDKGGELLLVIYSMGGDVLQPGSGPLVRIPVQTLSRRPNAEGPGFQLLQLVAADRQGSVVPATIGEAGLTALPRSFRLSEAYPNPVGLAGSVRLDLDIPEPLRPALSGDAGRSTAGGPIRVVVEVFNVRGQRIRTVMDSDLAPGAHTIEWDGRTARGGSVGAGLYVVRVRAGATFTASRKVIVANR